MGTYDAWLPMKNRSWTDSKEKIRAALSEGGELIGAIYGVTTALDGTKYLAMRVHNSELEHFWEDNLFEDRMFWDDIIWACDDGTEAFVRFVEKLGGKKYASFDEAEKDWDKVSKDIEDHTDYWQPTTDWGWTA